jgi:hypothetical protein
MAEVSFVQNHPEFIVSKQRDPNTPKACWLVAAIIKHKRLESEGTAASQLCVALQSEINDFAAELRDTKNKSDAEVDAITAALADTKVRLAAANAISHAKVGLAERAHKAIEACRHFDSNGNQPVPKKQSLKSLRDEIERNLAQTTQVQNSQRPIAELEQELRAYLETLTAPRNALVNLCAAVLNANMPLNELTGHPNQLAGRAFGMALSSIGADSIIQDALAKAKANDTGCMRLATEERDERLVELAKHRYLLELEEEQLLGENERRPQANPAAVLQIPADVAEQAGLLENK